MVSTVYVKGNDFGFVAFSAKKTKTDALEDRETLLDNRLLHTNKISWPEDLKDPVAGVAFPV